MARRKRRGEGSVVFDRHAHAWVARVSLGVRDGKRVVPEAQAEAIRLVGRRKVSRDTSS